MKRMNRRKFAKLAGSMALTAPIVSRPFATTAAVRSGAPTPSDETQVPQQQAPASATPPADAKPKYGMTKEQEERVKQSIERRERQNAALRARTIPYATEAAFVFKVQARAKRG